MKKLFTLFLVLMVALISNVSYAADVTLTMNVNSSPATGGTVSLDGDNYKTTTADSYKGSASLSGFSYTTVSHDFYLYALANEDYVFKGWAESNTANSGNTANPYTVTMSKKGALGGASASSTYYAIFAKMKATDDADFAFGQVLLNHSKTLSVDIEHTHAGTITATIEGDEAGVFAITQGSSITSNQNDQTATVKVTYSPVESETEAEATLVISSNNGLNEIRIALSGSCPPQLTPIFTLAKTTIELDEVVPFTFSEYTNPEVVVADESIVSYDADNRTLTGMALGTTTVTLTQAETDEVHAGQEVFTVTVTKIAPRLAVTEGGYAKTLISIEPNSQTTIAFSTRSDAEVNFVQTSGEAYVSYNNKVLKALGKGVAVFVASQAETDRYFAAEVEVSVWVKTKYHVPVVVDQSLFNDNTFKTTTEGTTSWDNDNGMVIGDVNGGGFSNDDKYVVLHFEGIPDKLIFEIAVPTSVGAGIGSWLGGVTNVEWFVKESATATMPSTSIWTDTYDGTNFKTYTVQLQPTTRYVLLCYSGNFGAYFRNVQITELKYVQDPEPASVDFGASVIYTGEVNKTVNVNWCNIAPLTVESSNPRFTVSPAVFGNYDQMGSQEITITYTHTAEIGANEADITISNGNALYDKTIHVSAETTKRMQTVTWNPDLAATGFAMNVGEQYPDDYIAIIATTPSGERITYSSSDNAVVEVIDDTILLAKAKGTAEITAYQAGDAEYAEVSDTKVFTVTDLRKQTITWDQNLYGLLTTSEPVELTATATSGMAIEYTSANENVVRIEDNMLIVVGEGETTITATQAGGFDDNEVEWLSVSQTNYVIVRNPAAQCNEMALSVGSLELKSGMLSREFALAGAPTSLTFTAKHGEKANGAWAQKPTYAALLVDQYTKVGGVWGWQNIYNTVVGTDETASGTIQLDEIATKVRFRTTETGTEHTITNIRAPRKKFMRVDVTEVDENVEANAIWRQNITVSHSNIDLMSLSTKQGLLTLSANTLGGGCGDYGDAVFEASYTPTQKFTEYLDTIVISDGKAQPTTIEIPVRLYAAGLNQYITGFELPATCLTTEIIEVPQATSTSGLEVVYLSSDSTIAYVENNVLVILSAGDVEITAYQAGNDRYREVSISKTISIQLTPVQILVDPTATEVAYGESVGMALLRGGEAEVEGTFRWADPEQVMTESMECQVVFIPTLSAIFATATTMVSVTVTDQPATYGEYAIQFCAGDSAEYEGKWYYAAIQEDVTLAEKNRFGGDSIVTLTVTVLQHSAYAEEMTITYGDAAMWNGHDLSIEPVGTRDLVYETTNAVGCDSIVTLTLTVSKQETLEVPVELVFCEGGAEEYRGVVYEAAGDFDVPAEGAIRDTLYKVNVTVHPVFAFAEEETVYVDAVFEWQGAIRATNEVGTFTIEAPYTTVNGCDSIYTLTLIVNKQPAVTVPETLYFCQGDSVEFRNKWYKEAGMDAISALGEIRDTLFNLTIIENLPSASNEELTIIAGKDTTWHEYNLAEYAAGSYELIYTTTNMVGCDSTVTLALTVEKEEAFEVYYPISFCDGDSAEYRGKWYYESEEDTVLVEDEVRDTVIYLTVAVLPVYMTELNEDTLHVGDTLFIEADVWYLGEELVADTIIVPTEEGEFDLTRTLKNEFECDSVIVRHVVVEAKPVDPEIPTGWENVDADKKAVKVLRDGVIYIRREGKEYIVDGRLAK